MTEVQIVVMEPKIRSRHFTSALFCLFVFCGWKIRKFPVSIKNFINLIYNIFFLSLIGSSGVI